MCLALPTSTHLALALLKLAMPTSLRCVGHLFGVGKATAGEAFLEVCGAGQVGLGLNGEDEPEGGRKEGYSSLYLHQQPGLSAAAATLAPCSRIRGPVGGVWPHSHPHPAARVVKGE